MELDLNLSPSPSIYDDLKQSMLRHESVFRDQVRELHRVYWTQRNLMHEVKWKESEIRNGSSGPIPLMMKRVDVDNVVGASRLLVDINIPFNEVEKLENDSIMRSGAAGAGSSSRVFIDLEAPKVIDLEKLPSGESDEELEICCLEQANHLKGKSNSGMYSASGAGFHGNGSLWDGMKFVSSPKCTNDDMEVTWGRHKLQHVCTEPNDCVQVPASAVGKGSGFQLCKQIDLNVAQDGECIELPDQVQNYVSPPISSFVLDSNSEKLSRDSRKISGKEHYSATVSSKGSCSNNIWRNVEYSARWISREKVHHSDTPMLYQDSHASCSRSVDYPCETRDDVTFQHLRVLKSTDVRDDSGMGPPCHNLNSNCEMKMNADAMDGSFLHPLLGCADLPAEVIGNLEEKLYRGDGSEEDTVSSHAVVADCLAGNGDQLAENTDFLSAATAGLVRKSSHVSENCGISPCSVLSINERVSTVEAPETCDYVSTQSSTCISLDHPMLQDDFNKKHMQNAEIDSMVTAAASMLIILSTSESSLVADISTMNASPNDCDEFIDEENPLPQCSLDSYERLTLSLEEMRDDGSSTLDALPTKTAEVGGCGINLRRGRGYRDFQKDILPGLVALARHEICDDLHSIGYQLRKNHSAGKCVGKQPAVPRSRLLRRLVRGSG